MRRLVAMVAAAATAVMVAVAPSAADPTPASGAARLQHRLDDVVTAGAVGALAQVRDEQGVWRGSSGVAAVGSTRPVPARGRFRAGSITKTFVATVVLQLVDEGRLRLDDPVEAWLPGTVPGGRHITVRQLLNHTSGLPDYRLTLPLPPSPEFLANRWRTWTPTELIERAVARPPMNPPGASFAYSNTNYLLLGQLIEQVTGRRYGTEIERRIIRPLRLHDTELPGTSARIRGPHPHGYARLQQDGETRLVDFTEMNPSLMGPAAK